MIDSSEPDTHSKTRFTYHNGDLHWHGCNLPVLAHQYGTPLYVVNTESLRQAYTAIQRAFQDAGLDAEVFFSVKTNPLPEVVRYLLKIGAGAEVISEYELQLVQQLGCPAESIIVNGPAKSASLLRLAVETGVRLINVESLGELESLRMVACEAGRPAHIGIRLNPAVWTWRFDMSLSSAASTSHFGFSLHESGWQTALQIAKDDPNLRLDGFHFHLGTGIKNAAPYRHALSRVFKAIEAAFRMEVPIPILDMGGGFRLSTVKEAGLWETVRLFLGKKGLTPPKESQEDALIREVSRFYAHMLHDFSKKYAIPVPTLFLEPGRALCGASQALLLTVQQIVPSNRGSLVAICDGGAMGISPLLLTEYHRVYPGRDRGGAKRRYRLTGTLPTPLDVAANDALLPELKKGDVVAISDVGAYFTSLGNNFAGPRPAVVSIEGGHARLVRRRETFDDLVSRDIGFPVGEYMQHDRSPT